MKPAGPKRKGDIMTGLRGNLGCPCGWNGSWGESGRGWRVLGGQGTERMGVDVRWEEMGEAGGEGVARRGLFEEKSRGSSSGGLGKEVNSR